MPANPQNKRYRFDWTTLNHEGWRGPGLSFPVAADLVIAPEFNELVIAAVSSFPEFGLIDPDEIQIVLLNEWERGADAPQPFGSIGASDLGLRLHYFEGDTKEYLLKLKDGSKPVEILHHV